MHRIVKLNELVNQWLELGLDETCVTADTHSRLIFKHNKPAREIVMVDSRIGLTKLVIGLFENTVAYTTGYQDKDEHAVIGLAIWAFEQTLEKY